MTSLGADGWLLRLYVATMPLLALLLMVLPVIVLALLISIPCEPLLAMVLPESVAFEPENEMPRVALRWMILPVISQLSLLALTSIVLLKLAPLPVSTLLSMVTL